jgi:hypothetical protein
MSVTYLLLSTKLAFGIGNGISHMLSFFERASCNEYFIYFTMEPIYIMYIHYFSPSFSVLPLDCGMGHWPDFTSQMSKSHAAI